jgi:dihydroorotate dehydrogenase
MKQSELEKISLGNAAGTIKTLEQVMEACRSAMTNITVGSITLEQRHGNQGDTYYYHPQEQWSLNALGLPNPGRRQQHGRQHCGRDRHARESGGAV